MEEQDQLTHKRLYSVAYSNKLALRNVEYISLFISNKRTFSRTNSLGSHTLEMRFLLILSTICLPSSLSLNNGKGFLPALGWNSDYKLNSLGASLRGFQNEDYIQHSIVDFLVSSGLRDLGYINVNMDASWNLPTRDASGNWQPDPTQWPSGLDATVAYTHKNKLNFGLYGDRGTMDCAKNPGNLGHEVQDANFLALHEIDFYKSDSCYASGDPATAFAEYGTMRDALNASGRHIWFALCGWETFYAPQGHTLGNSWRIGPDTGSGWLAVMANVEAMLGLAQYAGPTASGGGWNDMSLLLLPGMGAAGGPAQFITPERHRAQFSLHCIMAANMLLTGNLSSLDPFAFETWSNAEAVAVNQDPGGAPFIVLPMPPMPPVMSEAGLTFAQVAECGGEPAAQNWTRDAPLAGFLQNEASSQCLNVDNCGVSIIYDGCKTTGGTCAGPNSYNNEQWSLSAAGALQTRLPSAACATAAADGIVSLAPCAMPLAANQTWAYTAAGQLQTAGGLCLTVPPPPPPPASNTTRLLLARPLTSSSRAVALLALNNLPTNATLTCTRACFSAMGFVNAQQQLAVRDLWTHADLGVISADSFDIVVAANGSVRLLKLTLL